MHLRAAWPVSQKLLLFLFLFCSFVKICSVQWMNLSNGLSTKLQGKRFTIYEYHIILLMSTIKKTTTTYYWSLHNIIFNMHAVEFSRTKASNNFKEIWHLNKVKMRGASTTHSTIIWIESYMGIGGCKSGWPPSNCPWGASPWKMSLILLLTSQRWGLY